MNDLRKDYLLNRWVVIATHRKRRPIDLIKKDVTTQRANISSCPFCPGNEQMTPPASLVYLESRDGKILKEKDIDGLRHKDWLIRCVPNLYSAFSPPKKGESLATDKAVGHHEVLVESPNHDEHPAVARTQQLIHMINGYVDRLRVLSSKPYVRYVSVFRNHGLEAGASLSHAHSQIIATPMLPRIPAEEIEASRDFHEKNGTCFFCEILERERKGPRFIWEDQSFLAFAPWAAVHPFEFWIVPKAHAATFRDIKVGVVEDLASAMKTCLGGLKSLLNDPPYNYGFHLGPNAKASEFYHWHLEVYPKLTIWAGFEKSTGMYINTVTPEIAAENLRKTILN